MVKSQYFTATRNNKGEEVLIDCCIVIKCNHSGVEIPILITRCWDVIAVTSLTTKMDDEKHLIMLYKDLTGVEGKSSYEKFMYIVGKMTKKETYPSSKYFEAQRKEEHLKNGITDPDKLDITRANLVQIFIEQIINKEIAPFLRIM